MLEKGMVANKMAKRTLMEKLSVHQGVAGSIAGIAIDQLIQRVVNPPNMMPRTRERVTGTKMFKEVSFH